MSNILFAENLYFDVLISLLWYYKTASYRKDIDETFLAKTNRHENYFINECEMWDSETNDRMEVWKGKER